MKIKILSANDFLDSNIVSFLKRINVEIFASWGNSEINERVYKWW
jgi:hypothetical protein